MLPAMKLVWKDRFVTVLRQARGDRSEVEYARFLGIKRSILQRILTGRHRIEYSYVEMALRKLGVCHCAVAALNCPHKPGLSRLGVPE